MGSLATLLVDAGHRVTGSDPAPRPPMSHVLAGRGIEVLEGPSAATMDRLRPDLVVVGNVCRRDNVEALRAEELGLERVSMPGAIRRLLVPGRRPLVVAGTHGKTTTASLLGVLLLRAGLDPTILVGGLSLDLGGSSRTGGGPHLVIEGDEYDSAFFEKVPKFWSYEPHAAIIGSVQHDHLDIYPDEASYVSAFEGLVERLDPAGLLVVWAGDPIAVGLSRRASCPVAAFALEGDERREELPVGATLTLGSFTPGYSGGTLEVSWPEGGTSRLETPMPGAHNGRNALAALVVARRVCGVEPARLAEGLAGFRGVALRQQHVGTEGGVRVYRDFAHHPEAVAATVRAMRPMSVAGEGRLVAVYEPRTATACRALHQAAYVEAFDEADLVVLAPLARTEVAEGERLDTEAIAEALRRKGKEALATRSLDEVVEVLAGRVRPGDLVLLLSNGHFGGVDGRLLARLEGAR